MAPSAKVCSSWAARSARPWTWAWKRGDSGILDRRYTTAAAGTAPRPSRIRQVRLPLRPEESSTKATSGPTIRPRACIENTSPTRRPRSLRLAYSLISTAETG